LTAEFFNDTVPLYYEYSTAKMLVKPNPTSGVPIYLQIMEQIKHAIATGALRPGDQLPGIRALAETLVMNPNTVAKVYRELEHEGVLELRHGMGAFVTDKGHSRSRTSKVQAAQPLVRQLVEKLRKQGLGEEEIRRLFEAELIREEEFVR
jgi:GntR family transcriptional regulator